MTSAPLPAKEFWRQLPLAVLLGWFSAFVPIKRPPVLRRMKIERKLGAGQWQTEVTVYFKTG